MEQKTVEVVVQQGWSWAEIAAATLGAVVLPALGEWVRRRIRRRREVQRGA